MKWTGKSKSELKQEAVRLVEEQFMSVYPYNKPNDGKIRFTIPDGSEFSVFTMDFGKSGAIGLEYFGGESDGEDGDLYYIEDYDTPEAMFAEMLEETRR